MSSAHSNHEPAAVAAEIRLAVERAMPGARVEVTGAGGHYSLVVTSAEFAGKSMIDSHRLVLSAIAHLMRGDAAPVHAVDSLRTVAG